MKIMDTDYTMTAHAGTRRASKAILVAARRFALYLFLSCISLAIISPLIWMFSASLKTSLAVFDFLQIIPKEVQWVNYVKIWGRTNLAVNFANSIKLTLIITVGQVLLSSFAAYAFAKIRFPRRDLLFIFYISTLSVPFHVIMIPQFIVLKSVALHPHLAIVLILAFNPLGVFLFRQFFMNIPDDLLDSARIDGLSEYRIYRAIVLPLSRPAILALGIFAVIAVWNDFIVALLYIYRDEHKTIQLGMRSFFSLLKGPEYNLAMAVAVCSVIPVLVLFVLMQKYLVEGIAMTGLKG
jgi:multiple sugar transport system permease protein